MKKAHLISACLLVFLLFTIGCKMEDAPKAFLKELSGESPDVRRGWRAFRRGSYEDAIFDFNHALKHNPHNAEAYIGLAMAWEDKGDYDRAIEYFSKAIELEPRAEKRAGYFYFRALVWPKKNNFERAIEDNTNAIDSNPSLVAAYVNRAYHYRKIGKLEAAVADYDKVLTLTPSDTRAYDARKEVLAEMGTR